MVQVTQDRDGAFFAVQVVPRASRNAIAGFQEGTVRVRLTAPPVEGAANRALIKYLAAVLRVPKSHIEIRTGHTGRQKLIQVRGMSPSEVEARLRAHL